MAKIDFLEAVRDTADRKQTADLGKFMVVPVLLGAVSALLIVVSIALGVMNFASGRQLAELNRKAKQAAASVDKAKSLSLQKDTVARQIGVLDGYLKRNVEWSAKLAQLQEMIPQEVWLTHLSFETSGGARSSQDATLNSLLLSGNLVPFEGVNFLGALSNFINILKENKDFYGDFDDLILTKSSSQKYKDVTTMAFEIRLPLKAR